MDARHFDTLTRALSEAGSRRGVLSLLATLPVFGGLFALLDPDEADAKGRRKRRKKRHKHGKGRRKHHKKKCKPHSTAKTCNGKCGSVKNNCKKTVNCGSCDCEPACEECFTCQGAVGQPGSCVPEADGTPCGDAATCDGGTVTPQGSCDGSGTCEPGSPVSCAPYTQCDGDACATRCADDDDCVAGSFCNGENHCVGDAPDGQPCDHGGQCASGFCVNDVCCDSACNGACDACNLSGSVGACATLPDGDACAGDNVCCSGTCQECCDGNECSGDTPICLNGTCEPCSEDSGGCPVDTCCNANSGACVETCPASAPICRVDNVCAPCETDAECGAAALCVDGACQACDVVDGEVLATAVSTANDGDTLYVCAGAYTGGFTIAQNITLVGAGQGTEGTVIQSGVDVLTIAAGTASQPVTLRNLRIQNGNRGIRIDFGGRHLTMTDCTVRGNSNPFGGSGILNGGGTLNMTRCTVENNTIEFNNGEGGGLFNDGGPATLTDCLFQGNSARLGGGIFLNSGAVILRGTRVTNNTASGGSGIFNGGGTVTLQDGSTVCANHPTADQCHGFADPGGACTVSCPAG